MPPSCAAGARRCAVWRRCRPPAGPWWHATSPGAVAADGTGRNGTYTRHLLRFMTEPNLPVELMFKQVRLAVEQETNGQQIPWELSSLRENFAFNPGAGGATSSPPVSTPAVVPPPPSRRHRPVHRVARR